VGVELSPESLAAAVSPGWQRVAVVAETGSTNADLLADVSAPDRSVLVAEHQTAGRGRLDRTWTAPAGRALTFSVLLRPVVPVATWGWLPLLAGVALREAVVEVTGLDAGLKWPNDLLAVPAGSGPDPGAVPGKLAGILAQTSGPAVVVGIGLNVSTAAAELPVDSATSLALCGVGPAALDRARLLVAVLTRLGAWLDRWQEAHGDASACGLARAYRDACWTLGRRVSVAATSGQAITGTATGIDAIGRLLVEVGDHEPVAVGAGDVVHLR
jgi:BirA family biotin operon repressor/biotin-[acetyl-CoA-carboxylase] ligase